MEPIRCPLDAPLAADEQQVFERFASLVPLHGLRVLEIGGRLPAALTESRGVRRWCSVDPRNTHAESSEYAALRGIAEELPLDRSSVDAVFASNSLQHVLRPEAALAEAARVLKPGGVLYANFGPIWSAPDGSHVEAFVFEGQRYDFWTHTLLPAWAHLVLDRGELTELLSAIHGNRFAAAIVEWLETSKWTNRLTLRDYARLCERSPLSVRRFAGTTEFGYGFTPPATEHPLGRDLSPPGLAARAEARYGLAPADLLVRDLEIVLEKR